MVILAIISCFPRILAKTVVPISLTCGNCQQSLTVKDEFAGKRGKCPKCQSIIPIPAARVAHSTASTAPPAIAAAAPPAVAAAKQAGTITGRKNETPRPQRTLDQLRTQILGGFQADSIKRVRPTPLYQLGILLTTILMVILPLIYLAITGLVCLVVLWHLTHSHVIFSTVRGGRTMLFALLIFAAPLVVGVIVIVFMFKPLFAPPAKEGRRRSLTRTSDPLLFEFVERICNLVGAAMPRRIDIDCNVNASASFRRAWLSLVTGRDLVLTIGMPLAAGLSLQQFAGVLAHEFGHFSQGAGMRLTYIIRSINFWFVRVVYQRDAWDEWLETVADGLDLRISWIIYLSRGCVWLTRRILWCLMYVGHLAAGFMLRQMEFDADKYETRLAGSANFAGTSRQLRLLGLAWHGAEQDLASYYRDGRLVDDMPRLLLSNLKQIPKAAHEFIDKSTTEMKTGWFDTHPSDEDRIAASAAEQAAGVFHSQLPARVLFSNFEAASKGVTWDYYCTIFGKMVDPKSLHSTADLVARTEGEQAAAQARDRFFAGAFSMLRPLALPIMHLDQTQSPAIWREDLAEARQLMESQAEHCRELLQTLDKADSRFIQARQARGVLYAGVRLLADHFEHKFTSVEAASKSRDAAAAEKSRVINQLQAFETAAGRRLRSAIMLLFDPATARRIEGADRLQQECRELLPLVSLIANLHASILELRNNNATLAALLGHLGGNERDEGLIREIIEHARRVRLQLGELKTSFDRIEYPFDHASGKISVSSYLIKLIPQEEQVGDIYQAAGEVIDKLFNAYGRALNRLCVIAETVEIDQGYQPLPSPAEEVTA
jgi:hypothetical protein